MSSCGYQNMTHGETLELEVEKLKQENENLREAYKNKPVSTRKAMKVVIQQLFELLGDEKGIEFTLEQKEEAIEKMHDDVAWFEGLIDFFEDHLDSFGENYGVPLYEDEEM